MRHFFAMSPLPICVVASAVTRALVSTSGLTYRGCPHRVAALSSAIPIPSVAPAAEEEHLPALGPATHDKSQRVHGPGAGQKLDARPDL